MFVLVDCIGWLGHLVALVLLYKETGSVILIYTKSFSQNSESSFSLYIPSRLCMLFVIALHAFRHCWTFFELAFLISTNFLTKSWEKWILSKNNICIEYDIGHIINRRWFLLILFAVIDVNNNKFSP